MTDLPIPFTPAMILALLDGRKTQTRRVLKPKKGVALTDFELGEPHAWKTSSNGVGRWMRLPRDKVQAPRFGVGDRLWVREAYFQFGHWEPAPGATRWMGRQKWRFVADDAKIRSDAPDEFRKGRHPADPETKAWHKRLGRFMPRRASRLTLIVESVRIERPQDISRDDAIAEGLALASSHIEEFWRWPPPLDAQLWLSPVEAYRSLWGVINGPDSWAANPWVAAITFRVVKANIDALCVKVVEAERPTPRPSARERTRNEAHDL